LAANIESFDLLYSDHEILPVQTNSQCYGRLASGVPGDDVPVPGIDRTRRRCLIHLVLRGYSGQLRNVRPVGDLPRIFHHDAPSQWARNSVGRQAIRSQGKGWQKIADANLLATGNDASADDVL
jgi:hypothetical protein